MASEFIIEGLKDLADAANNYARARGIVRDLIRRASNKFALEASAASKDKYLTGGGGATDVLNVRTGRLRSSITPGVAERGDEFTISLGTGVPYGPIHEYGGAILRGGKVVGQMRERSFLRRAFHDTIGPFGEDITSLIQGAAQAGFSRG